MKNISDLTEDSFIWKGFWNISDEGDGQAEYAMKVFETRLDDRQETVMFSFYPPYRKPYYALYQDIKGGEVKTFKRICAEHPDFSCNEDFTVEHLIEIMKEAGASEVAIEHVEKLLK